MRLSVAIITYNRSKEVMNAVDSVIGQLAKDDQLVIVDNGSNEGHAKSLDAYCNRIKDNGRDVLLEHLDSNLGVAGGRNIAWQCSTGKAVLFLDDDCVVADENLLEKIRQYLSENRNVGALAIRIDEPITGRNHNYSIIFTDCVGHKISSGFCGVAHVINRLLFDVVKLYPDTLFWGAEERYATLRIWDSGLQVHLLPDAKVLHFPETTNEGRMCSDKERTENGMANYFVINRLLLPSLIVPAAITVFILRLCHLRRRYGVDIRKMLRLAKGRYDRRFRHKISMKAVLDYASKFGYRSVL